MKMSPLYLILDRDFFFYKEDVGNKNVQFVRAWHSIVKKDRNQLGNKSSTSHESYLQWVIDRATQIGMPYPLLRSLTSTTPTIPFSLPPETMEEYRAWLTESERENATWKRKYHGVELLIETMSRQLEQKDHQLIKQRRQMIERDELLLVKNRLLDWYASKKKCMDLFAGAHSDSDDPPASRAWGQPISKVAQLSKVQSQLAPTTLMQTIRENISVWTRDPWAFMKK